MQNVEERTAKKLQMKGPNFPTCLPDNPTFPNEVIDYEANCREIADSLDCYF